MNNKIVVVYGPQGSGKTRNAEKLKNHFKMQRVFELDSAEAIGKPQDGDLVLTTQTPAQIGSKWPALSITFIPIDQAIRAIL